MVDPALVVGHKAVEPGVPAGEAVGLHLARQAALKIADHRDAEQLADDPADRRPFVQVAVDHVRPELPGNAPRLDQQQRVDIELVPRRAGRQLVVPGHARRAVDGHPGPVVAQVIGADLDLAAQRLKGARLLVNADVTPPVGEKGGGSDHEDLVGGLRLPSTRITLLPPGSPSSSRTV